MARLTAEQQRLAADPAHLELARDLASHHARRWPGMRNEFLSAALLGLCQAAADYDPAHGTAFPSYAFTRVKGAILDSARMAGMKGYRRRMAHAPRLYSGDRAIPVMEFEDGDGRALTAFDMHPAPELHPDPDRRVLTLWCDTRTERLRLNLDVKTRVWLYLWLVEGWTLKTIAAAFGLGESTVASRFAYHVPQWETLDKGHVWGDRAALAALSRNAAMRGN